MARFFEALKAGARAFKEGTQPSEYSVAGRPVRCPHCGEEEVRAGERAAQYAHAQRLQRGLGQSVSLSPHLCRMRPHRVVCGRAR